jgi:6-phosphogluconolactonase
MVLVIGSYNKITDPAIHLYRWDVAESRFIAAAQIAGIENPSYLHIDQDQGLIYAVTEKTKDSAAELHIYHADDAGKNARLVSCTPFQGMGSCYISCNSTHAFVTNYGDGTLTVIKLPKDNQPGVVVQHFEFSGRGPNHERQDQPHLHAALLSGNQRYLYCSDLGSDRLYHFSYQSGAGDPLQPGEPPYIELPPGSGPRHMALSPDASRLYLITELSGEIFVFDPAGFSSGWLQRISLLQEGYSGKAEAADLQINASGSRLYASNRGDANEILVYSIDPLNGHLEFIQRTGAAGLSPRSLLICEEQSLLLAANEQSDNISVFRINGDGTLEFTRAHLQIPCPTCLKIFSRNQNGHH